MARTDRDPLYMPYTQNPHAYEYNIFPEMYFCGTDVGIYFNKIQVTQSASFGVTLQEQHRPVYGYASRTFDQMAIGNRIVVGNIKIPFTDAKYMRTILKRIEDGLEDSANANNTDALPDNRKFPPWMKNALDSHGNAVASNEFPKIAWVRRIARCPIRDGPGVDHKILRNDLVTDEALQLNGICTEKDKGDWYKVEWFGTEGYVYRDWVVAREGMGAMPTGVELIAKGDQNASVALVQKTLNKDAKLREHMGGYIQENGDYSSETFKAVNFFKSEHGLIQEDDGIVGPNTWRYLSQL